jgi:uncharacterized protein YhaN
VYHLTLTGALCHTVSLGTDTYGNLQRIDHVLEGFSEALHSTEAQLENVRVQLANAKEEVEKPFPQEEELSRKQARLDELNIVLNLDKRENEILDGEQEEGGMEQEKKERAR